MTTIEEIFGNFFTLIDDIKIHLLKDELKKILLVQYLKRALALDCRNVKIEKDKKDNIKFSDIVTEPIVDENGLKIGEKQYFPYVISETDKWILAYGMLVSYLTPKLNREKYLRASVGDRDYTESSHANQLKQLESRLEKARHEVECYKNESDFDNFEGFN